MHLARFPRIQVAHLPTPILIFPHNPPLKWLGKIKYIKSP